MRSRDLLRRLRSAGPAGYALLATALVVAAGALWWWGPSRSGRQGNLYPYQDVVERRAAEFDLDAHLVAAVIDNESGFDPDKRSPDGALGLMQVMPDTGRLAAGALKIRDYRTERLTEPDLNVRLGCWYLARLLDAYDGDLVAALAAYNAGPGSVEAWRRTPRWRSRRGVERIPLLETRSYVTLVLQEYEDYRRRAAEADLRPWAPLRYAP